MQSVQTLNTPVAEASTRPAWNSSYIIDKITPDEVRRTSLSIRVWDYLGDQPGTSDSLLGTSSILLAIISPKFI